MIIEQLLFSKFYTHNLKKIGVYEIACKPNTFTLNSSIKATVYQRRIRKQKITKVSPLQVHCGKRQNTPLSNISTKHN